MEFGADRLKDAEIVAEFAGMFPLGFAGPDVLTELAPEGWERSPLVAAFHPSLAQLYDEAVQMHRNIESLKRPDDPRPASPEPTWDEITQDYRERAVEPNRELRELVGQCLWDIFSDSHDVMAADGRRLDLGSFRAGGGFLADLLNRQLGTNEYDYMSFYMGTIWISGRVDLAPVYRMIFRRLRERQLNWTYHFPRLYAVDMRPLKQALEQNESEWAQYDPCQALAEQEEERRRDEELAELRETLEKGHKEAVREALKGPPPATVRAYQEVYGRFPNGWPPSA